MVTIHDGEADLCIRENAVYSFWTDSGREVKAHLGFRIVRSPSPLTRTMDGFISDGPLSSTTGDRPTLNVQLKGDLYATQWYENHTVAKDSDGNDRSFDTYWYGWQGYSITLESRCPVITGLTGWMVIVLPWMPGGRDWHIIWCRCSRYDSLGADVDWCTRTLSGPKPNPPSEPTSYFTWHFDWNDQRTWGIIVKKKESGESPYLPWQLRLTRPWADNAMYALHPWDMKMPLSKGDLCQEAVEGTKVIDINTCMYVKDMLELASLIRSTVDSVKDFKRQPVKAASDLFLSYHYGYRLSYRDTVELVHAATAEFRSVTRSMAATRARGSDILTIPSGPLQGMDCLVSQSCKVWYRQADTTLEQLLVGMFRWDVFPELSNVYDLIPYSFVVDWFLPFGDVLEKIDYHTYASCVRVVEVWYSERFQVDRIPVSNPWLRSFIRGYGAPGGLSLTSYHRWHEFELSYPQLALGIRPGPKNWIPAAALILQRTK